MQEEEKNMHGEETPMTEKESLELIASMIQKAKNSYIDNGWGPLAWGTLIVFCSLFSYAEIKLDFRIGFDIWLLSALALVPQIYFVWKSKKQSRFTTHDERMMNFVWTTFAICMFMLSYYSSLNHPPHQTALVMMMFGIPTFITGGVRKFNPMLFGGLVCWICSIASCFGTYADSLLLMGVSALFAWLIPGIILRRRFLRGKACLKN